LPKQKVLYNSITTMRQITPSKTHFIEKILRDTNGRLICATFCVYEKDGHIKARLVGVVHLEQNAEIENKVLCLCGLRRDKKYQEKIYFSGKTVSPYFTLNILYSTGSKPRAPTK
jgi:hypothetical protein